MNIIQINYFFLNTEKIFFASGKIKSTRKAKFNQIK